MPGQAPAPPGTVPGRRARFFTGLGLLWRLGIRIGSLNIRGARLALLGVVLGVSLLSMALSVVRGYERSLRTHLLNMGAHMEVVPERGLIPNWQSVVEFLYREEDAVELATPFFVFSGGVQGKNSLLPLQLRSIVVKDSAGNFAPYMVQGSSKDVGLNQLLLGTGLARDAGLKIGDTVVLLVGSVDENNASKVRYRRFRLVGLFHTGTQMDRTVGITNFATGALIAGARPGEAGGIDIRVVDPLRMDALSARLSYRFLTEYSHVVGWQERHGALFATIDLSRRLLAVLLLCVIIVAAFNVVGSLLIAIDERRYELARLLVMGASPSLLVNAMLVRSLYLGLVGGLCGMSVGVALASALNPLLQFMEFCCSLQVLNLEVYFLDRLPVSLAWGDLLVVMLCTIAICVSAGAYPAWRISQLRPVRAMSERAQG